MQIDYLSLMNESFDNNSFTYLFIEYLGWNYYSFNELKINIDKEIYYLHTVAEKCGVVVFHCLPNSYGDISDFNTRNKIEKFIRTFSYEHIIIFTNTTKDKQIWQWVDRNHYNQIFLEYLFIKFALKPSDCKLFLKGLSFSLDEDESLSLLKVVDRINRIFYDQSNRARIVEDLLVISDLHDEFILEVSKDVLIALARFRLVQSSTFDELSKKISLVLDLDHIKYELEKYLNINLLPNQWKNIIMTLSYNLDIVLETLSYVDIILYLHRFGLNNILISDLLSNFNDSEFLDSLNNSYATESYSVKWNNDLSDIISLPDMIVRLKKLENLKHFK